MEWIYLQFAKGDNIGRQEVNSKSNFCYFVDTNWYCLAKDIAMSTHMFWYKNINRRAKMALYCSPEYQTSDPLGWGHFLPQGCNLNKLPQYCQWSFESTGLLVQEKRFKTDFQDGFNEMILAICDLQVTQIIPIKFQVNWPYSSGEEFQNRFSRCWLFYKSLWCFLPNFESFGLSVQENNFKMDFQDGNHLGFLIWTILAFFDLQITSILPMKFRINWPFG